MERSLIVLLLLFIASSSFAQVLAGCPLGFSAGSLPKPPQHPIMSSAASQSSSSSTKSVMPFDFNWDGSKTLDHIWGSNLTLYWAVLPEDGVIRFAITALTSNWVGIGLSDDGSMSASDLWIFSFDQNTSVVSYMDAWAWSPALGCEQQGVCDDTRLFGRNDLVNVSGSFKNGMATYAFQRAIDTNDALDKPFLPDSTQFVIWAFGQSPVLGPHNIDPQLGIQRGTTTVNFFSGSLPQRYENSRILCNHANYRAWWTVKGNELRMALSIRWNGWFAFGLSSTGTMRLSDMWIGAVWGSGDVVFQDYWTVEKGLGCKESGVCLDVMQSGREDLYDISGSIRDGVQVVEFRRLLDTGDPRDVAITTQPMNIIWAYSAINSPDQKTLSMHSNHTRSTGTIPFMPSRFLEGEYDYHLRLPTKGLIFHWKIQGDDLLGAIQARVSGWVAFGISQSGSLEESDLWVGYVDRATGIGSMVDYWCRFAKPCSEDPQGFCPDVKLGGTNDIELVDAFIEADSQILRFKRRLLTGDSYDMQIQRADSFKHLVYAWGDTDQIGKIIPSQTGSILVNFFTGASSTNSSVRKIYFYHGVMMLAAFPVFHVLGAAVARYLRRHTWWLRVHVLFSIIGLVLFLGGMAMAVSAGVSEDTNHFGSVHQILGLSVLLLSFASPMLGVFSDQLWDPRRKQVPIWPDRLHHWLGILMLLLGYASVISGLNDYGSSFWETLLLGWGPISASIIFFTGFEFGFAKASKDARIQSLRAKLHLLFALDSETSGASSASEAEPLVAAPHSVNNGNGSRRPASTASRQSTPTHPATERVSRVSLRSAASATSSRNGTAYAPLHGSADEASEEQFDYASDVKPPHNPPGVKFNSKQTRIR